MVVYVELDRKCILGSPRNTFSLQIVSLRSDMILDAMEGWDNRDSLELATLLIAKGEHHMISEHHLRTI